MPTWSTNLLSQLRRERTLPSEALQMLIEDRDPSVLDELCRAAQEVREIHFGKTVYIRGLIELTNICRNDCYYCGIRRGNKEVERYRLSQEQILACCERGYQIGFRTFVLQGGEDPYWTKERIASLVAQIRTTYPDCAITLSLGEWSEDAYLSFLQAGANRYLLRHETFDPEHYQVLHPKVMSSSARQECLRTLKRIGFQTGTGMMVGSPGQTTEHLIADIRFIEELQPQMIGMGPFLPHRQTPLKDAPAGSLELTIRLLAILRLMHPKALIPSTTALATLHPQGRIQGILAGANVVMPNLSPPEDRGKYQLYNDKAALGAEAAEGLSLLQAQLDPIGYSLSFSRGDYEG